MRNRTIVIFLLHFFITVAYLAITGYYFVQRRDPDPIGTGLQQWACIFAHLFITSVVCLVIRNRSKDKKSANRLLWINLLAIVTWLGIYFLMGTPIWDYMWSLRDARGHH